ncbi:hypothetical protein [Bacillus smithii]|uniref:hypothetical protein n=1 Tax=Bacillus smithii TaxID=1479 RepID=UPI0030C9CB46
MDEKKIIAYDPVKSMHSSYISELYSEIIQLELIYRQTAHFLFYADFRTANSVHLSRYRI